MKVVNKNFVMWDFVYKCNASLPCTCHTCSRLFICSKLTVQFYHLRSLWTHCSLWCNGWLAVLSLVVGKILYRLCNSCCLYNCIEEHKLNFDCKHPECTVSPDRFRCEFCRWHFSKHLHQCINCGVQKELNWTAYQGRKKILQLQLSVHVCNCCSLFCFLLIASCSLGKAIFSLLQGLLLVLNFSSVFCCCLRGVLPCENLHPLFECRAGLKV